MVTVISVLNYAKLTTLNLIIYVPVSHGTLQGCSHAFDMGGASFQNPSRLFLTQILGAPNPDFTIV